MNADQLRLLVIRPTLEEIGAWSEEAEELLMATAAHESELGHYVKQKVGPACGIYQMEPATHDDLWANYLKVRMGEMNTAGRIYAILSIAGSKWVGRVYPEAGEMIGNLYYATAMARVNYLRVAEPLPAVDDLNGIASYWYRFWCRGCRGTEHGFKANYNRLVRHV